MKTEDLIKALYADASPPAMPINRAWYLAAVVAAAIAAAVFFVTIGPRSDVAAAAATLRFLLKLVVAAALATSAFMAVRALSRPDPSGEPTRWLLPAPMLLAGAVVLELAVLPPSGWRAAAVGSNSMVCLTYIPLIGTGPLAVFLAALRYGAPTRPVLAGTVAGLTAGGIAAALYALHCTDDSPLFVATWYSIAVAGLALLGALLAPLVARW